MPATTTLTHDRFQPRGPLDNQRNIGGDMSMMFFARSQCPRKFTSPEQHQIKNLNFETIAGIIFPPPTWITNPEYRFLLADSIYSSNDNLNWCYFSLNFSMYNQSLDPSEWDDRWFSMYGRVHPYALTWEVEPDETSDGLQDYTIPVLTVRDQGYQP